MDLDHERTSRDGNSNNGDLFSHLISPNPYNRILHHDDEDDEAFELEDLDFETFDNIYDENYDLDSGHEHLRLRGDHRRGYFLTRVKERARSAYDAMTRTKKNKIITLMVSGLLLIVLITATATAVSNDGRNRKLKETTTDKKLGHLAALSDSSRLAVPDGEFLKPFLVPRVSGTAANVKVRDFIVDHFTKLRWDVQVDNFTDPNTPHGAVTFGNVVATKSPNAGRRMILAAHFDSKYFPPDDNGSVFIGATDSAVPCALLLDVAYTLDKYLDAHAEDRTLQMVFFDGEEAFKEWTATDSIYGARHLADKWSTMFVTPINKPLAPSESMLDTIDLFVLLDLLGTANPTIPNTQPNTTHYYEALQEIESRLDSNGLLEVKAAKKSNDGGLEEGHEEEHVTYFSGGTQWHLEDDHVPFMNAGVPIVHFIQAPFDAVWHTFSNMNVLFRVFVAQYFEIEDRI